MKTSLNWTKLLSHDHLRRSTSPAAGDQNHEFLADYYRVVFCSAFRRLQDKTQVSPLAPTDFVRRRLTHSVEVSIVGERMARVLANRLQPRLGGDYRDQMGRIVATACLLHDIGNPPFGHEGELAIREWTDARDIASPDYRCFDGNAQGFRIAVRLQHHGRDYGLNLTAAVLATVLKYPGCPTALPVKGQPIGDRGKFSFLSSEQHHYDKVRSFVGLPAGQRHPLCYVVEAADDIVNRLVDIEDAIKLKFVTYRDLCEALSSSTHRTSKILLDGMEDRRQTISVGSVSEREMWAYQSMRVEATRIFANACEEVFEHNLREIEEGSFDGSLIKKTPEFEVYSIFSKLEQDKIFGDPSIVRVECGGKTAIRGLLDLLYDALLSANRLGMTIPDYMRLHHEKEEPDPVARVVDYVSGMTDGFAVKLYQELCGMSL